MTPVAEASVGWGAPEMVSPRATSPIRTGAHPARDWFLVTSCFWRLFFFIQLTFSFWSLLLILLVCFEQRLSRSKIRRQQKTTHIYITHVISFTHLYTSSAIWWFSILATQAIFLVEESIDYQGRPSFSIFHWFPTSISFHFRFCPYVRIVFRANPIVALASTQPLTVDANSCRQCNMRRGTHCLLLPFLPATSRVPSPAVAAIRRHTKLSRRPEYPPVHWRARDFRAPVHTVGFYAIDSPLQNKQQSLTHLGSPGNSSDTKRHLPVQLQRVTSTPHPSHPLTSSPHHPTFFLRRRLLHVFNQVALWTCYLFQSWLPLLSLASTKLQITYLQPWLLLPASPSTMFLRRLRIPSLAWCAPIRQIPVLSR